MAVGTLSVAGGFTQTNDQRIQKFYCTLVVSAFADVYPVGGIPLRTVLANALLPTTSQAPLRVLIYSGAGSGYIYQYISANGKMMILQVPASASLTTAAPLKELDSVANALSGPFEDTILCTVEYLRNA